MDASSDISDYILQSAAARGIDPKTALRVAQSEGLNSYVGDGGSSFGPFQLHYGGVNPSMPHSGVGDLFTAATGLDARDPKTVRQQIDFALDHAKEHGWGAWMGAKNVGIMPFQGISSDAPRSANMSILTEPVGDDVLHQWAAANAVAQAVAPTPPAAKKGAAPQIAPTTQAPQTVLNEPIEGDLLSQYASASQPSTAAAGVPAGSVSIGEGVSIPYAPSPNAVADPPSNVLTGSFSAPSWNPSTWSISRPSLASVAAAGRSALDYGVQQAYGIPSAVSQDYQNAKALTALGNQENNSGNAGPSFPALDPRSWQAGGALHFLSGVTGEISSPLTGLVRQTVEQPVTDMTGSPAIGERAGIVANVAAAPFVGRALSAPGAIADAALGKLNPETARLADIAQTKYGIPISSPQMAGENSMVKIGSNALDRLPFSGGQAFRDAQMRPWHSALAAEIGEPGATALTPDVMSKARTDIGAKFDNVANNTTLRVDMPFAQRLHDVLNNANATLTEPEAKLVQKQVQEIYKKIDPHTGEIDGQTYLALTKTNAPLNSLMNSDNSNLSIAAKGIDNALDDLLSRSASPEYRDMLSTARRQWAALKTLEPLAAKAPEGQISPALLAGRVNAQTGNGMAYGWGGNFGELARIGQRFLKEPGSSNTAERTMALSAAGGLAGELFRAASGGMSLPEAAYTLGAIPTGLALSRGVNAAAKSRWLSNSLINRSLVPSAPSALNPTLSALGGGAALLNKPINPSIQPPVSALTSGNQ